MSETPSTPSAAESLRPRTPEPPPPPEFPDGARLAGYALLVNAALSLIVYVVGGPGEGSSSMQMQVVPLLFDCFVAVGLIGRKPGYIAWAVLRAVLGVLLWGGMALGSGRAMEGLFQLLYVAGLLLLLVGNASAVRQRVGVSLLGAFLLFSLAGVSATVAGYNPLGTLLARVGGTIVELPEGGKLVGKERLWELTAPPGWYLRDKAQATRDNPLAEHWLTRPDVDAHVLIIPEQLAEGTEISPSLMRKTVLDNARSEGTDFVILDEKPMRTGVRIAIAKTTKIGRLRYDYLVFAWKNVAVQVIALSSEVAYARAAEDFETIFASFRGLPDALLWPDGGRVQGDAFNYALALPNDQWRILTDGAAVARKPTIDRWLARPDIPAQVLVIPESLDGARLSAKDYAAAIIANAERAGRIQGKPTHDPLTGGELLRFHAKVANVELAYLVGAYIHDDIAVQVMTFVAAGDEEKMAPELEKLIRSFERTPAK